MKINAVIILVIVLISSCNTEKKKNGETLDTSKNGIINSSEWIYLFDSLNTVGWRGYNKKTLPPQWVIEDGTLSYDAEKQTEDNPKGGNDIIYVAEEYDNFELEWEWKIPKGGNSGVLYHVHEGDWKMSQVSPEYQMLDDLNWDKINNSNLEDWQKTGADYAMYAPDKAQKIIKPIWE